MKIKNLNMINSKKSTQKNDESQKGNRDYIVNEAQMVISNYISNIERQGEIKSKHKKRNGGRHKVLKTVLVALIVLFIMNLILMGVI
ncbi:MAG: hypothetical protein FWC79_03940 [Oscillospiraceae bacterium]|nr:hypothetical protein [Oscillospiraceae bacterium]